MLEAQAARVAPVEAALLAEDRLHAAVVARRQEAEVRLADAVAPVAVPTRERARLLAFAERALGDVGKDDWKKKSYPAMIVNALRQLIAVSPAGQVS